VLRPSVLLLDEPLGALDAKLRKALRQELTTLHREVGVTFVFVTHDQEEALEMSDRLAVMELGRLIQCGSPRDVYAAPLTAYVADFLGVANLLKVNSVGQGPDGLRTVRLGDRQLLATPVDETVSDKGHVVIRPERIRIVESDHPGNNRLSGTIDRLVYVGATTQVLIRLADGARLQALVVNDSERDDLVSGRQVSVTLPPDALRLLSA
jgi:spermidine/putrescine transport system ATP-binding protein